MPTAKVKLQDHGSRSHALLSASGANRWMNCTPSARLEEEYGEKFASAYAKEGTLAHELAELYLLKDTLNTITDEEFQSRLETIMSDELFSEDMLTYVPRYTDYCTEQFECAESENGYAVIEVEQKLNLTEYIPDGFGTADCVIISDGVMEVIDLKYGKGVQVMAEWNKQLMIYGLGALRIYDALYDISEVRLTIVQPRLDSISSWQISVKELLDWANNDLRTAANMAFEGKGELSSGEWCKFCAVRNRCRKLYEQQLEIAKYEFKDPELLTDEEIADVVLRAPKLVEWVDSIAAYAQNLAVCQDKHWPGLKLVEGRSVRKWSDEFMAESAIKARFPELTNDDIYNLKLKPITSIEKVVGKKRFEDVLHDVIVKPQGKPTLVPESDKRPAIGIEQAKADFSD